MMNKLLKFLAFISLISYVILSMIYDLSGYIVLLAATFIFLLLLRIYNHKVKNGDLNKKSETNYILITSAVVIFVISYLFFHQK